MVSVTEGGDPHHRLSTMGSSKRRVTVRHEFADARRPVREKIRLPRRDHLGSRSGAWIPEAAELFRAYRRLLNRIWEGDHRSRAIWHHDTFGSFVAVRQVSLRTAKQLSSDIIWSLSRDLVGQDLCKMRTILHRWKASANLLQPSLHGRNKTPAQSGMVAQRR